MSAGLEFLFGGFRLSIEPRALFAGRSELRIGRHALELLVALAERPGQVVSKEELIARAWPVGGAEETSLRFHIRSLRRLLGDADGSGGQRFITNVSGRGYALVAPVTPLPRAVPSNLPRRLTRVLGRQALLATLQQRLATGRCLTIAGAAGMGKSTLALALGEQLLERFPHGVWFVDLSVVTDPALIPSSVATALGVGVDPKDALAQLLTVLQDRQLLIVLDNCEHLVAATRQLVAQLLGGLRGVHLLATSREALGLPGEEVVALGPLDTPAPEQATTARAALQFAAVQLFVERARASDDAFQLRDAEAAAVGQLCRRLDGMPFAIELAAARVDSFGVQALLAQLEDRLLLHVDGRRGGPQRHKTLRHLLDWSYAGLPAGQQALLRRLAIFASAFSLQTLANVLEDAPHPSAALCLALEGLQARSLLRLEPGRDGVAYRLLDTTRLYALEKLEQSPDHWDMRSRHVRYLCGLLQPSMRDWARLSRQGLMEKYAHLGDEVRAALAWSLGPGGDLPSGLQLLLAAAPLSHLLAHPEELALHTENALRRMDAHRPQLATLEHQLWLSLGSLWVLSRGAAPEAEQAFARARALGRSLGLAQDPAQQTLLNLSDAFGRGAYRDPEADPAQAVARFHPEHDPIRHLAASRMLAQFRHHTGQHEEARQLALFVARHPSPVIRVGPGLAYDRRVSMNIVLARIHWLTGRPDLARCAAGDALEASRHEVPPASAHVLAWASCPLALWSGDLEGARVHVDHLKDYARHHRLSFWAAWADAYDLVLRAREAGQPPPRAFVLPPSAASASAKLWDMLATLGPAYVLPEAMARAARHAAGWCEPEVLRAQGELALAAGHPPEEAQRHLQRAQALARQQGALAWELRATISLAAAQARHGLPGPGHGTLEALLARYPEGSRSADLDLARALLEGRHQPS